MKISSHTCEKLLLSCCISVGIVTSRARWVIAQTIDNDFTAHSIQKLDFKLKNICDEKEMELYTYSEYKVQHSQLCIYSESGVKAFFYLDFKPLPIVHSYFEYTSTFFCKGHQIYC